MALGGRLDHTLATVSLGGDTRERVGFLLLEVKVSHCYSNMLYNLLSRSFDLR